MSKKEYDDLTAEDIFGIDDQDIEELNIEQWKGKAYMRTFTGTERSQMQAKTAKLDVATGDGGLELMLWVIIHGLCDGSGKRLFKDDKSTQDKLKNKQGSTLEAIAQEIMRHNALKETVEEVEKEAKNS